MTWVDFMTLLLIVGYGVGGFFTGALVRLVGLVSLYIAFVAATNMGLQAGGILQQSSNLAVADSRIYGFFGIVAVVLAVIEVAAFLTRSTIKIEAIVFNRVTGVVAGVITGILLSVVVTYELSGAGNPFGGSALDSVQQSIRDAINGSHVAEPLVRLIGRPIILIFQPVLPPEPQMYFGPNPVA